MVFHLSTRKLPEQGNCLCLSKGGEGQCDPWSCPAPSFLQHCHENQKCHLYVCFSLKAYIFLIRQAQILQIPLPLRWPSYPGDDSQRSTRHQVHPNKAISPGCSKFDMCPEMPGGEHLSGTKHRDFQLLLCKLFVSYSSNSTHLVHLYLSWVGDAHERVCFPRGNATYLGIRHLTLLCFIPALQHPLLSGLDPWLVIHAGKFFTHCLSLCLFISMYAPAPPKVILALYFLSRAPCELASAKQS